MITKVSSSMVSNAFPAKSSLSFGFAKLNNYGRKTASSFNMKENKFLDTDMYKKQFGEPKLSKRLNNKESFTQLCYDYGCTNNSKANADFIVNQVLNPKSEKAINNVNKKQREAGYKSLYFTNYDNPELSLTHTKALLERLRSTLSNEEYIKNIGLLEAGTEFI